MEAFCGTTSSTGCRSELALLIISTLGFGFVVLVVPSKSSENVRKNAVHYPRAITVLALSIVYALEVGEYVVAFDRGYAPTKVLLVPISSLLLLISASVLNERCSPHWVVGQICAWLVSIICRTIRFYEFKTLLLGWSHVRFTLTVASCALLALLLGMDILTLVEIRTKKHFFDVKLRDRLKKKIVYTYGTANAFSQMTFWWLNKLLILGYKDPLELEDLGSLPIDKSTSVCIKKFNTIYNNELMESKISNKPISLWKTYFLYIKENYILGGVFKLMGDCVGLIGPLGITIIIEYAKIYREPFDKVDIEYYPTLSQFFANGYVMAIIILVSIVAQGTLSQSSTHIVNVEGIRLKSALQALIYDKCLKLGLWSSNIKKDTGTEENSSSDNNKNDVIDAGAVTNLISEDSYNIMRCIWIGHYIWAIPLKISVIMYFLYSKLGISAIIGAVLCIFIMTPLQFVIGKAMSSNSEHCIEYSDQRIIKINEILQGIKILKMHGWENIYEEKISSKRKKELKVLNKDSVYWALITFLTHASSTLITLVTFGLYSVIEKEEMTPGAVFAGLALFNQLTVPLFIFPVIVPIIISAIVSTKRLKEFLLLPEVNNGINNFLKKEKYEERENTFIDILSDENCEPPTSILGNIQECEEEYIENISKDLSCHKKPCQKLENRETNILIDKSYAVSISDAQFVWGSKDQKSFTIYTSNIINIPKAKITMIIGKTGSGKSSFLSALINEMNMIKGNVTWQTDTSFAYVPQTPWLANSTIRDNILFGNEAQTRKYKKVLAACCLNPDLSIFPNKDLTEVGEAGGGLSGGQKQRISLARAMYSSASVLLLDDPLASLDQTVSKKIFEKGLKKFCLNHKRTIIMVTHDLQLLSHADQIIYINDGIARSMGTLANVEILEPTLALEWKTLLAQSLKEEKNIMPEKTAKERWQLVKLVNKFSSHFKAKLDDETNNRLEIPYIPIRKRLSTYHGSRYLTHDLFLPTDECDDDIIRSSIPQRSSTKCYKSRNINKNSFKKHKVAERSSSLQVVKKKLKSSPIKRQSSTPSIHCDFENILDKHADYCTEKNSLQQLFRESPQKVSDCQVDTFEISRQGSRIKRFFSKSIYKKRLTNGSIENEHMPIKRLISTNSNISEDYNDEDDIFVDSNKPDKTILEEEREYGKISKQIYLEYFKACGVFIGTFYLISTILWQGMRVYTDICLSDWTNSKSLDDTSSAKKQNMSHYVKMYSLLSILSIILSLLSNGLGQYAGACARKILHKNLLNNILKCPHSFFQSTPLGRIINRFSIDVGIIDKKIATSMQRLLQFLFLCSSAIIINAIINPWFLIIALPICVFYYSVQKFYRSSARELQRLDAMTKSPIFSHYNETICGVSLIRAYGQQERYKNMLWNKLDVNTNAFLILNSSNCWLGIALDYLGAFIVFVAIMISLISIKIYPETITPSLVGLAINYTLLVPIYLNWVVKFLSDMEMYMSAVERVLQFTKIPAEDAEEINSFISNDWLQKGDINFDNVSVCYNNSKDLVLKNINLNIPSGQKVAICGRTGSGKSSLILSLLRMVDICEGSITIDHADIKYIPVNELRNKLAVVPQEVVLFGGSVRENLDPKGFHDDDKIWETLELTQLKSTIESFPGGLNGTIREGGGGWNCGAKQLMGVTNCILQNSLITLLDEPTAALDHQTEHNLLNSLLSLQKSQTVIMVAHRLSTIMNYDRIIVIDAGKIVEDGSPNKLLSNPTSLFTTMVKAAEETKIL